MNYVMSPDGASLRSALVRDVLDAGDAYLAALASAGRCILTPGFRSRPHACFQLLTPEYDELLSNCAFNCNLRHYIVGDALRAALLDAITETEYPHGGAVQVDPGLTPS